MKAPSLLVISDYYAPHWTGITKGLRDLCQYLSTERRVTVCTVQFQNDLAPDEEIKGVRVLRSKATFALSRAMFALGLIWNVARQLPKHDAVLINSPCIHILPCAILAKLFRRRLAIFHQGDLILREGLFNRIIERVFDLCTYIACSLADVVSTYQQDYANQSRVLGPFLSKFQPMLMPIRLEPPPDSQPEWAESLSRLQKDGYFLYGLAGRFVWEKGIDILFKAAERLISENPKVRFVFAGPQRMPYEDFLGELATEMKRVEPYCIFLGLLNEAELSIFYDRIDCILIPSRSDCFPLVQAEACLAGNPSVVTDIPGARMLVKSTGYGLVVAPEDAESLRRGLTDIVEKRDKFEEFHENVRKMFSKETILMNCKQVIFGQG